jgi:hypothetical protein
MPRRYFDPSSVPCWGGKRTIAMQELQASGSGKPAQRKRPAARILWNDAEDRFRAVVALDETRVAVTLSGGHVDSPRSVEIRSLLEEAPVLAAHPGCGGPLYLSEPYLLSSGELSGGYEASTRVIDLRGGRVVQELPVSRPYVLTRAGALFARIRKRYDFESAPIVAPSLAEPFPGLHALIAADGGVLVKTDLRGAVAYALSESALAEPYPELIGLALSRDQSSLYYAGKRSVGALDVNDGRRRWVRNFGENTGSNFLAFYALALAPDEARIAVGGTAGVDEPALRVLDARDGRDLHSKKCNQRIEVLAFRGALLFAADNQGNLSIFDEEYSERRMRPAQAGIEDLAFTKDSALLACRQHELRVFPLLTDEAVD